MLYPSSQQAADLPRQQVRSASWAFCTPRGESPTTITHDLLLVLVHGSWGGSVASPGMAFSPLPAISTLNQFCNCRSAILVLPGVTSYLLFPAWDPPLAPQLTAVSGCPLCAVTGSCSCLWRIPMKMLSTSFLHSLMLCSLPSCSHSSFSWKSISSCSPHLLQTRTLFSPAPAFRRCTGYFRQPEIWRALSSHWSCDLKRGHCCARGSCSIWCWELCPVVQHYCWWVPHGLQQISGPLPCAFLRAMPWDLCSGTANTSWMGTWPSLIRISLSQQQRLDLRMTEKKKSWKI